MSNEMWRAHVIEEPEFEQYLAWDERNGETDVTWGRPVGWEPSTEYVERFKTNKFLPPSTDKWYRSRSSARRRVELLEGYGYRAVVQRSAPVQWPAGDERSVRPEDDVAEALRIVKRHGFRVA